MDLAGGLGLLAWVIATLATVVGVAGLVAALAMKGQQSDGPWPLVFLGVGVLFLALGAFLWADLIFLT